LTFVQCYCAIHPEVSEVELLTRHHRLLEIEKSNGGRFEMGQLNGASLLEEVASDLRLQDWVTAPLTALIGHCFEALGWGKVFPAYAEGMLELAHEAMGQRKGTLSDFLTFWDRVGHRRSIRVSGGSNAVQIMTPHKAKGLDFKVVITSVHPENIDQFKDEIPVLLNSEEFELPAALLRNSDMKDTDLDEIRLEEIERTVVDALNVAYVTMTRAVERLDVNLELTSQPALDMEIKTLPQLLWKGWQEAFAPSPGQGAPAEFGIPDRKRHESDEEKIIVEQSTQELLLGQPFAQKIARPRVNWSEMIPAGEWTPQQFGTALHSVMSLVHGAEDWPAVRAQIQSSALGPETERLIQVVDAILSHPKIKPYFDAPSGMVFAERSMGLGAGEVVRPDRVVRLPDGWHVIDFKTGAPKDRDDAQVRSYCSGIFEMYPEEQVHGWLIYTDPLQVKEVPLLFGVL